MESVLVLKMPSQTSNVNPHMATLHSQEEPLNRKLVTVSACQIQPWAEYTYTDNSSSLDTLHINCAVDIDQNKGGLDLKHFEERNQERMSFWV